MPGPRRLPLVRPALGLTGGFPGPGLVPASRQLGMLGLPFLAQGLGVPTGGQPNQIAAAGYRLGDYQILGEGVVNEPLVWIGDLAEVYRFKITLNVRPYAPDPPAADEGTYVNFYVKSRVENETTHRWVSVTVDNAAVIYVPSRSLEITATRSQTQLVGGFVEAHYALDEASAGISEWYYTQQDIGSTASGTYKMEVPPFCKSFRVFMGSAATPQPTLNAYDAEGTLVYTQLLTVPESQNIPVTPGLNYYVVIPASAAGLRYAARFKCEG